MRSLLICFGLAALWTYGDRPYAGFRAMATARDTLALFLFWTGLRAAYGDANRARGFAILWICTLASLAFVEWNAVTGKTLEVGARTGIASAVLYGILTAFRGVKLPSLKLSTRANAGAAGGNLLDQVLFCWGRKDPYTVRDLLQSMLVLGQTGSGKTSSVLALMALAILKLRRSGGLILASKPEELLDWARWFSMAGRSDDLIVFDSSGDKKFNCVDFIVQSGGDAREVTQHLTTVSEALGRHGEGNDPFWAESQFRLLYNAVVALMIGLGRVTLPELKSFIVSAKQGNLDADAENAWKSSFHYKVMVAGEKKAKSDRDAYDYKSAVQYWSSEYPFMDNKPRSSILAGVMNVLSVLNTGMVRDLISTETNVSPRDMEAGKWVLVNLPIDEHGQSGKIIMHSWKLITQKYILRRHVDQNSNTITIIADEAQDIASSFDHQFLAKSRSHYGSMLYLTQSIHSFMGEAMGHAAEHKARTLFTNFRYKVAVTLGDLESATYLCGLLGERVDTLGSFNKEGGNISESMQKVLQPIHLLTGLRSHGGVVDGYVFRSGIPFSTGENHLRVQLEQL